MNYRIQEILRYIISGVYIICTTVALVYINKEQKLTSFKEVLNQINNLNWIILFLLPVFSFLTGYVLEILMSIIEHKMYTWGFKRPSTFVLTTDSLSFKINCREKIFERLDVKGSFTNKNCGEAFQKAKQIIDRKEVEEFYYQSVMARNLFGAQLVVFLLTFIYFFNLWFVIVSFFLLILLFYNWIYMSRVYAKYVLAEFVKCIPTK